jgi:glycosyltransferase involved in cell wall biosynthesis
MKPLRIALLTSAPLPPREGIGFHVVNLAAELRQRGHTPTIISRGGMHVARLGAIDGIPTVELPFAPAYPIHVQLHGIIVNRYLRDHRADFDIVHAHSPLVPVPGSGLPLLTTVHTPMRADTAAIRVTSVRSALIRAQGLVSAHLESGLFARSDEIVAVAHSVADELAAYGLDPASIAVLGNAVDPQLFAPNDDAAKPGNLLYVGRLSDRKGLADLVEATAIVARTRPATRLVLVGSGPLEGSLRGLAAELGIGQQVEFAGHIDATDRERLVGQYQQAATYVQPSHYEGLPTALLEAMACARPVVATAISGHLDAILPDKNGLLVPAREPAALATAIGRLLDDPGWAAGLGRAARQTVLEHYSWTTLGDAYEAAYDRLLAADQSTRSATVRDPAIAGAVLDAR